MTRNDTLFKILFAIEISLLPLVMAADILLPTWSVGLFVAGVLVAKIWLELFKDKENRSHLIINSIGSIATVSSLVIFFTIKGYIESIVLCVFVVILVVLMNTLKVVLHNKTMPEMVNAVDSCNILFECLLLVALTFVAFYQLVTEIALFAIVLTSAVSVLYKLYYICKYHGVWDKIKGLFRKR